MLLVLGIGQRGEELRVTVRTAHVFGRAGALAAEAARLPARKKSLLRAGAA